MKKNEQLSINSVCELMYFDAMDQFKVSSYCVGRLRSCKAHVYRTEDYYILYSYNTPVAIIELATGEGFDLLRKVYGYTATSAQHISKFFADYASRYGHKYRWYSA